MGTFAKWQCLWVTRNSEFYNGKLLPAEHCGCRKDAKAKNPNYPGEETQYEPFCPKHMAKWVQMRKEKARNEVNEDIDFDV